MLIIGAKGHAKEILAVLEDNRYKGEIFFFDDISKDLPAKLYGTFPIIKSIPEAREILSQNKRFVLGIGKPVVRKKLLDIFSSFAEPASLISRTTTIGRHEVFLGESLNIMFNCFISNSSHIKDGSLVNSGVYIHHDVKVGAFCELAPGVKLLGGSKVGDFSFIGANAVVLPGISIGSNVVVGAGAVVNRNVPDNALAVGVPSRILPVKIN